MSKEIIELKDRIKKLEDKLDKLATELNCIYMPLTERYSRLRR